MTLRRIIALFAISSITVSSCSFVFAGHTRPAYVDGCQSLDSRYVVTAEAITEKVGKKESVHWKYHWQDTKTGEKHSGWLTGPRGLGPFDVTYGHLFMPPGGETFALWLTASWAQSDKPHPGGNQAKLDADFVKNPAFGARLTIYKRTGEAIKKYDMCDLLKPNEGTYVNWVQGNLYWLAEYPDVMKGGEPARRARRITRRHRLILRHCFHRAVHARGNGACGRLVEVSSPRDGRRNGVERGCSR